ncbi:MAG: hypothetical protein KGH53_01495 [Candidatus Micrarchaeota archaeon]|nr:hypothetical protein [Candidatus Micrarchaeota archaeon]
MIARFLPALAISLLLLSLPLIAAGSDIISTFFPTKTLFPFPTSSSQITTISSSLSQFLSQYPIVAKFLGSSFNPRAIGSASESKSTVILPSSSGQRANGTTPAPSSSVNPK